MSVFKLTLEDVCALENINLVYFIWRGKNNNNKKIGPLENEIRENTCKNSCKNYTFVF